MERLLDLDRVRLPALPLRWERVVGAEALTWVVLMQTLPILAIVLTLTVGLRVSVLPWSGPEAWWEVVGFTGLPWIDNDYWWHLATGNWILENGRVPMHDPFSWTNPGKEWVAHEWLAELIMAVSDRIGGYRGGILLTAVVAAAGFWRLMAGMRLYGLSRRAICLVMLLWGGAFLRGGVIVVRPQVLTFALMAVLLAELAAYETGRRRSLWILPPLFAVWVNLNLTVLIGAVCLGAFTLDRLLQNRLDRHLLRVAILSGLALLLNPQGPLLLITSLTYGNEDDLRYTFVFEWMSPNLADSTLYPFVLALITVPLAIWQLLRLRVWPAGPVLFLAYQSFNAVRFVPIFTIVAAIFVAWLAWQYLGRRQPELVRERAGRLAPRRPWVWAAPAAAAALALWVSIDREATQFREEPIAWGYPEAATNILLEQYPDARLFNVYDYGGYLIYRFDGENRVYVDGREEMYGEEFLRHYFDLIYGNEGWRDALDQEGVTAVLIRHIDGLTTPISADTGWVRVYSDAYSALYVRRT